MTSTSIQLYNKNKTDKLMPSLTLCPLPAYKKKGIFYDNSTFMENTFSMDELFVESALKYVQNMKLFSIKTIYSMLLGRCYMISL